MAFVDLLQDGCHSSFHIHHGVESEPQIVEMFYLLQKCGNKSWVLVRSLWGFGIVWEHGEDVK